MMKRIMICIVVCLVHMVTVHAQQYHTAGENVQYVSGHPMKIFYTPAGTILQNKDSISAEVYWFNASKLAGKTTALLHKEASRWSFTLEVPDSAVLAHVVFASAGERDNNKGRGYLLPVYKNNMPLPFAYGQMSLLASGVPLDDGKLRKDQAQALAYMKEELQYHPENEAALRQSYYNMLANSPDKEDKVILVQKLTSLTSDREEDLMMAQLYLSYFGSKAIADSLDKLLIAKFPGGQYVKLKKQMSEAKPHEPSIQSTQAHQLTKTEINDMLIDEAVSGIVLKDLNGKNVAIGTGELANKIIVLDFWATWCGPCVASFPGMQQVMDKYRERKDIVFLYIATMEKGDAVKNIQSFLSKNKYPFTILLDEQTEEMNLYKAFSHYKVEGGIPYKLIIDKKGHIRFRMSGFSGDTQGMVSEVGEMIDMIDH